MSAFTDQLTPDHIAMIGRQAVFFVATAAPDARINLSPKGLDTFRVLSPSRVAYLDLAGSGNETHAHLAADGRITVMMCNFEQPALILRIYGRGRAVLPVDPGVPIDIDVDDCDPRDPRDLLVAASSEVDVLVCGSRCYGPHPATLRGGVTRHVTAEAACPVIVMARTPDVRFEDLVGD